MTTREPADDRYQQLSLKLVHLQQEAGAFLARSLADATKPEVSLRIAHSLARESTEVAAEMKAWRLAHGWQA